MLKEFRAIYSSAAAAKRVDYLIGYSSPEATPDAKASPELGDQAFGQLRLIAERGPSQPSLEAGP